MKKQMKQKTIKSVAAAVIVGSLLYIIGMAGLLEQDGISFKQAIIRMAIGLVALAVGTALAAIKQDKEDGPS